MVATSYEGRHELRIKTPRGFYRHLDYRPGEPFPVSDFLPSHSYGITPVLFSERWTVNKDGKPTPFCHADDAVACRCLWADIDGGREGIQGARRVLVEGVKRHSLPQPSVMIVTGGGLHCLWELEKDVDLAEESMRLLYVSTLKRLAIALGGKRGIAGNTGNAGGWGERGSGECRASDSEEAFADHGAAKLTFAVRIPGSYNSKYTPARQVVELPSRPSEAHSLSWWRAMLPALPEAPKPRREIVKDPGKLPPWVFDWINEGAPSGTRHTEATRVAGKLRDYGTNTSLIEWALGEFAETCGWRVERREIEQIARWAAK